MRILMLSVGTRGDAEPFVGIGEMLRERGQEVLCCFLEQFRHVAEENGFPFYSLGSEFLDAMLTDELRPAIGGKGKEQMEAAGKMQRRAAEIMVDIRKREADIIDGLKPDLIIYHISCTYALCYGMKTGIPTILFNMQPGIVHEVRGIPHVWYPRWFSAKLSYRLARKDLIQSVQEVAETFMPGTFSREEIKKAIAEGPAMCNVSPTLLPQPSYWPATQKVVGFWERKKTLNWTPPEEMTRFITAHEKIFFVTFGSMPNPRPKEIAGMFVEIFQELNIPAIMVTYAGGLMEVDEYDRDLVKFVPSIPYDWALPKMYATIHHGGSGTLHTSLRAGCASMVIPHLGDQFIFDQMAVRAGVGPRGIRISKLEKVGLKKKIRDLLHNPAYKANAEKIAAQMAQEDMADAAWAFIAGGSSD